jgi:hypothetical protein
MAMFSRLLVAQQAFIDTLSSLIIVLKNGGQIKSANYEKNISGFSINHTGSAEFNDVTVRGGLSGKMIGNEYLRIHEDHVISFQEKSTNLNLYSEMKKRISFEEKYPYIKCSGHLIPINSANNIYNQYKIIHIASCIKVLKSQYSGKLTFDIKGIELNLINNTVSTFGYGITDDAGPSGEGTHKFEEVELIFL